MVLKVYDLVEKEDGAADLSAGCDCHDCDTDNDHGCDCYSDA